MINVGIGEFVVTENPDETIITHALGSCVALILYCKKTKHTAMAHIVLPEPSNELNKEIYKTKPSYFATNIVPDLVHQFQEGIKCDKKELMVYVIGGADSLRSDDVFLIGQRNVSKIKSILKSFGIHINHLDTGGNLSRTVSVESSNGAVQIKKQKMIL